MSGAYDLIVMKYDSLGAEQWVYRYSGTHQNRSNTGVRLALDVSQNNVYVGGWVTNTGDNVDMVVIKVSAAGQQQWVATYDNAGNKDETIDLQYRFVNGQERIVAVADTRLTDAYPFDIAVVVYNEFGQRAFGTVYGLANTNESVLGVLLDDSLHVSLLVRSGTGSSVDLNIVRYDDAGIVRWVSSYPNVDVPRRGNYGNAPVGRLDRSGNILVRCDTSIAFQGEVLCLKFGPGGNLLWRSRYERLGADYSTDIALDDSNNVYLSADVILTSYTNEAIGVIKYDSSGNLRWMQTFAPANTNRFSYSIGVDKNRNVFVGGYITSNTASLPYPLLIKYAQGQRTIRTFEKTNLNLTIPDLGTVSDTVRIATDDPAFALADINVTIDTIIHPNVSDLEITLSHDGILDTLIYQVGGTGDDFIRTTLDDSATTPIANGAAPFTGRFRPSRPLSVFNSAEHTGSWVLRVYDRAIGNTGVLRAWRMELQFLQSVSGVVQQGDASPAAFSLFQNYPNPFNPSTHIPFSVRGSGFVEDGSNVVTLKVYDMLGREVRTLVNENLQPGSYAVTFDASGLASGLYLYRLQAGAFAETKKMILMR
jgi:subtilisin-like proprotein convertase family protein